MRPMKVFGIRRPLRSLPIAIICLALAQRLSEEVTAATALAAREAAVTALVGSQPKGEASESASGTDPILHEVGHVAELYLERLQTE